MNPSRDAATLAITNGLACSTHVKNGSELVLGRFPADAFDHLDAVRSQVREALAGDLWVAVAGRGDDPPDPCGSNALDTRTGAAGVTARLERAVKRTCASSLSGTIERDDLGVRAARAKMRALADHDAIGVDDDGANDRIG